MSTATRRRPIAIAAIGALLVGGLIAGNSLVSCDARTKTAAPAPTRPVTRAEAQRLAGVRLADYRAGHVGVQATIGTGASAVHLTGWVDWRRPLVYLNAVGPAGAHDDGLVQAIPGVVAVREGRWTPPVTAATSTGASFAPYPAPPVVVPPTGWRVRPIIAGSSVDTLLALLFALRSATPDDASQILGIGTRYVAADEIGGVPVDVLDGAAIPPKAKKPGPIVASASPTGKPFAAQGGQVRYWVDAQSRLLRAEALVDATTPVRVDFDRADRTAPAAIELLGGATVHPTRPTPAQVTQLSQMRSRDWLTGGGTITVAMPLSADELVSAVGWVDWQKSALYLTVRNNRADGPDSTLRADAAGVTVLGGDSQTKGKEEVPAPNATGDAVRAPMAMPSLRPPTAGWHRSSWVSREDQYGEPDFDALLNELLALAAPVIDSPTALTAVASTLRRDTVNGVRVTVYELRKPSEVRTPPGDGRLRYWVDGTGKLRRLELRTRGGAYGYVTIDPAPVPKLPDPVPAKPTA